MAANKVRILKHCRSPQRDEFGNWDESYFLKVSKNASLTEIVDDARRLHGIGQRCCHQQGAVSCDCHNGYIRTVKRIKRGEVYISLYLC